MRGSTLQVAGASLAPGRPKQRVACVERVANLAREPSRLAEPVESRPGRVEHERHVAQPEERLDLPEPIGVLAGDSEGGLVLTRRALAVVSGESDVTEAGVRMHGHDPVRRGRLQSKEPDVDVTGRLA